MMNWIERLFLAAVLLVAGVVIVAAWARRSHGTRSKPKVLLAFQSIATRSRTPARSSNQFRCRIPLAVCHSSARTTARPPHRGPHLVRGGLAVGLRHLGHHKT